jgi:hypothetical protein
LKTLSDGRSEQTQKVFENLRLKKIAFTRGGKE